jgi:hypothetical protein
MNRQILVTSPSDPQSASRRATTKSLFAELAHEHDALDIDDDTGMR